MKNNCFVEQYIIKGQECSYLSKGGRFIRLLTAGKYTFLKMQGYQVDVVPITGEVKTCGIPEETLMRDQEFASRVVKNVLPDKCTAIRFISKACREVITRLEVLFWNVFEENEFQTIDVTRPWMEDNPPRHYMDLMPARYYKKITIKDGETGLLYLDNRCEKRLDIEAYYFWNYGREASCKIFNMRIQQLDISGQEILTADKVAVRLNVICNYRIVDPKHLVRQVERVASQPYTYVQLKLREYVGKYRLDELLAQKEEVSPYVLEKPKERQEEYYVEMTGTGIKSITLPGEIKEIMNTVLITEKKAQTNVIMRREEVASTRSLLNTARLMDENQTLFKLKEMEYLERICDKVGLISLNGGRGVLAQLAELAGINE